MGVGTPPKIGLFGDISQNFFLALLARTYTLVPARDPPRRGALAPDQPTPLPCGGGGSSELKINLDTKLALETHNTQKKGRKNNFMIVVNFGF